MLIWGWPDQRGYFGEEYTYRFGDEYSIEILNPNHNWLEFKGIWGADDGSPPGPVFRHSKPDWGGVRAPFAYFWNDPIYWQDTI